MRRRHIIWIAFLACLLGPAASAAMQTPAAPTTAGGWWTAWSSCEITPVQFGSPPEHIPGMADDIFWLEAETTNGSDIDMIVWLWTGNRPLPLNGQYASDGSSTKWLWAFSEEMRDIAATVTSDAGDEGEVQFAGEILDSTTGPVNGWPSGVILPEPGCWTFDITAAAEDGDIYEGRIVFPAVP